MTVDEFGTALTDLETRVDRLRALYENWFRGYEKLEPGVARKDVERRVYGLRKELPRNTALRFRYHQLYQRYTTLATYWQRTARQIEEGTYRRQLQRIKRRRDDEEARTMAPPPRQDSSAPPPLEFELNPDETLDVRSLLDDFDLDQVASALEVSTPAAESEAPGKVTGQMVAHARSTGRLSVPDASALGPIAAAPDAAPRTVGRFARPNANAGAAAPSVGRGSQRPPPMAPANDVTKPPALPPTGRGTGTVPLPPPGRGTGTVPMPPPPSGRGTGTVPLPPPPSGRGTGTVPMPPPPGVKPPAAPAKAPPPLAAKPSAPVVASSAPAAKPAAPSAPAAKPATPSAPAVKPATPSAPAAKSAPLPAAPRPVAPVARPLQPSGTVARPPQISGTVARVEGLDDQRMRRIYEEYAAAKRKNNEAEVRYETLAGSISKMMPDLNKKHAGKQIDFEVVMKDGRVGLKPKAT